MADEEAIYLDFEKPIIELEKKIESLRVSESDDKVNLSGEIKDLEQKLNTLKNEIYVGLNPWQRVQLARHPKRPYTLDYVQLIFNDFIEIHGDRAYADDKAIITGLAFLDQHPVCVIGHQKGKDLEENMKRNFAMAHPEGYRKALRAMYLAEKFSLPIITFINTMGAYPGIGAEERGQAEAIAKNLREMANLKVPVISIVIGEGGSGGALGIGVANRLLMLENAYYSVITPEGCAAILYRDPAKAMDAAIALKITADDLLAAGVVDEIVKEPLGGAHRDPNFTAQNVKESLLKNLEKLAKMTGDELMEDRYQKYRKMGQFREQPKVAKKHQSANTKS
jgi:acetyl-CoA carboxylase carboxyl transferase subunit alpha